MSIIESTILIPTYNRPYQLIRLLHYYIKVNFDLSRQKFMVLDGSDKDSAINQNTCQEVGIEYHYYGPDIPIMERWLDGINRTKTEFVSFLADDDILQTEGYYACLTFLQANPEYSTAHGNYVWLLDIKENPTLYPGYQTFSIEHNSPLERLFTFLSDYVPITYGVYRTEILKTAYEKTISSAGTDNFHFSELVSGCIPVILGKVKKLDSNYYIKSIGRSSPRPVLNYPKLIFNEDFSSRYTKIKDTLKELLSPRTNPEIIDDAIDYCFGVYYGKILNRDFVTKHFTRLLESSTKSNE